MESVAQESGDEASNIRETKSLLCEHEKDLGIVHGPTLSRNRRLGQTVAQSC